MLHFVVRKRRSAPRTPVDDVIPLVDETLVVELREDLGDGARTALVEREAFALPVRGVAEHALLVHDGAAVLLLPFPHARHERLAPEILPPLAFLAQGLLDHVLRRDARVVRPRKPQGVVAAHAMPPHQNVLDRLVEGVAHVQDARHVGRRDDDRIRLALAGFVVKIALALPDGIPLGLGGLCIVMLIHISALR